MARQAASDEEAVASGAAARQQQPDGERRGERHGGDAGGIGDATTGTIDDSSGPNLSTAVTASDGPISVRTRGMRATRPVKRMGMATTAASEGKRQRTGAASGGATANTRKRPARGQGDGGRVKVARQIEVGAATIQRTVGGRYEWRDAQLRVRADDDEAQRAARTRGATYDDGG